MNMSVAHFSGPPQASSSAAAAAAFDADSAGASSEVGRLQGQYFKYFYLLSMLYLVAIKSCAEIIDSKMSFADDVF